MCWPSSPSGLIPHQPPAPHPHSTPVKHGRHASTPGPLHLPFPHCRWVGSCFLRSPRLPRFSKPGLRCTHPGNSPQPPHPSPSTPILAPRSLGVAHHLLTYSSLLIPVVWLVLCSCLISIGGSPRLGGAIWGGFGGSALTNTESQAKKDYFLSRVACLDRDRVSAWFRHL